MTADTLNERTSDEVQAFATAGFFDCDPLGIARTDFVVTQQLSRPKSRLDPMKPMVRSPLIAATIGASVALALVSFGVAATAEVPATQIFALLLAVLCPPWQMFWAGIGEPHNVRLWALLSAAVAAANALLYVPVGLAHAATLQFKAWARYAVIAVAAVGSLALGHLYFIP